MELWINNTVKKLKPSKKKDKGTGGIFTGAMSGKMIDWYGQNRYTTIGISLIGIVVLAVVIPVAIYHSMAASGAVSFEAESGQVGGSATTGTDANASGGSYAQFSPAGTGAPTPGGTDTSCIFNSADKPVQQAFCEGFNQATPFDARFSRGGEVNGMIWGASRSTNAVNSGQGWEENIWATRVDGCGTTAMVYPPQDIRICNGRLYESINDHGTAADIEDGGVLVKALYPKQPFDFAGRTGTVVFDLSADTSGDHAAWPEFWITDKPVPAPFAFGDGWRTAPRHGLGIRIAANYCPGDGCGSSCFNSGGTQPLTILDASIYRNYNVQNNVPIVWDECVKQPPKNNNTIASDKMNHFEVRVSTNQIDVYATDAFSGTWNPSSFPLKHIAKIPNANLSFTRGLIWIEDAHYNASKTDPGQDIHTFMWDNIGFDGPKTYRDLSFDVPDSLTPTNDHSAVWANTVNLGYPIYSGHNVTLQVTGVFRNQTPTSALVTLNWLGDSTNSVVPSFRVNGGPWHDTPWPFTDGNLYSERTIDVTIPVSETKDGTNTIEFRSLDAQGWTVIHNINLILVAGASVP